jgi:hypothetical protein
MAAPVIHLSTIQHYLPEDARLLLQGAPIHIPYRRMYEHVFSIAESDYSPLDGGSTATFSRRLDGRHPTERVFWFFRNRGVTMVTNELDNFTNSLSADGAFYQRMKLTIAGREREYLHEPFLWQDLNGLCKDECPSGSQGIGSMRWSLSHDYRQGDWRQPEGTVNFSTADRPTLFAELTDVVPNTAGQRIAEWRVYTEGWCAYEVKEGRGRMMFAM